MFSETPAHTQISRQRVLKVENSRVFRQSVGVTAPIPSTASKNGSQSAAELGDSGSGRILRPRLPPGEDSAVGPHGHEMLQAIAGERCIRLMR